MARRPLLLLAAIILVAAAPAAAQQYARPNGVVSSGSWTPSDGTLATTIDETSASDADYDTTTTNSNAFEVTLSSVTDPVSSSGHTIRVRTWAGTGTLYATVELMQGATVRATFQAAMTTTTTTRTYTLTAGEANSITDYADLRLRITSPDSSCNTYSCLVTWAELEVPSVATTRRVLLVQ